MPNVGSAVPKGWALIHNSSVCHWLAAARPAKAPKISGAAAVILCIQAIAPTAMMNADTEATNGHGLGSTIWNGWVFV